MLKWMKLRPIINKQVLIKLIILQSQYPRFSYDHLKKDQEMTMRTSINSWGKTSDYSKMTKAVANLCKKQLGIVNMKNSVVRTRLNFTRSWCTKSFTRTKKYASTIPTVTSFLSSCKELYLLCSQKMTKDNSTWCGTYTSMSCKFTRECEPTAMRCPRPWAKLSN